jgi:hypothetical protein
LSDEQTLYDLVRGKAPESPIILFSFAVPENVGSSSTTLVPPTMGDIAAEVNVDWTKTVVGVHAYWVDNAFWSTDLSAKHFPSFVTEFQSPCILTPSSTADNWCEGDSPYQEATFERLGISWMGWDLNDTASSTNLHGLQADAQSKGYWWPADQ